MRLPERLGTIAGGALTPLLDTLFLLIFALLALSDARREDDRQPESSEEVRIELPTVEPGGEAAIDAGVRITLRLQADGTLRVGDGATSIDSRAGLDAALARALDDTGSGATLPEEVTIEIEADRAAPHGVAVDLLQHLRLAGFLRVELVAIGDASPSQPFGGGQR
ncbi:MAG: hypothetical protein GY711_11550 [bacterium]|nr:hypothetical protein [bacterium]